MQLNVYKIMIKPEELKKSVLIEHDADKYLEVKITCHTFILE